MVRAIVPMSGRRLSCAGGGSRSGFLVLAAVTSDANGDAGVAEREALLFFLNRVRDAVVRTSDGLTDAEQRAPGVRSGTNLLGLVQHLTGMEVHWFQRVFLGRALEVDTSMHVAAGVSRHDVVASYREACATSDRIVHACPDLSTLAKGSNPGERERASLRRIIAHMIEETARHAGHGDILREQIDGATDL
jgi:uncharacterized protein DUF664